MFFSKKVIGVKNYNFGEIHLLFGMLVQFDIRNNNKIFCEHFQFSQFYSYFLETNIKSKFSKNGADSKLALWAMEKTKNGQNFLRN